MTVQADQADDVVPVDMVLYCPKCGEQHIDAPDERTPGWRNPPHKSHLCHACGHIWRPSDTPTNGVRRTASGKHADTTPTVDDAKLGTSYRHALHALKRDCWLYRRAWRAAEEEMRLHAPTWPTIYLSGVGDDGLELQYEYADGIESRVHKPSVTEMAEDFSADDWLVFDPKVESKALSEQHFAIFSPRISGVIGVCTAQGAEHARREDPGCELRPISREEFEKFRQEQG